MFCSKCGNEISEGAKFCGSCGTPVEGAKKKNEFIDAVQDSVTKVYDFIETQKEKQKSFADDFTQKDNEKVLEEDIKVADKEKVENNTGLNDKELDKISQFFVSPDEKYIASLGNGFLQNLLSDSETESTWAVLSDKRIYYYGDKYNMSMGLKRARENMVVNVEDVTGSGYINLANLKALLLGVIFAIVASFCLYLAVFERYEVTLVISIICLGICILFFTKYFLNKKTLLLVYFAGGSFGFNVKLFGLANVNDFHRQLRRVKDLRELDKATNVPNNEN